MATIIINTPTPIHIPIIIVVLSYNMLFVWVEAGSSLISAPLLYNPIEVDMIVMPDIVPLDSEDCNEDFKVVAWDWFWEEIEPESIVDPGLCDTRAICYDDMFSIFDSYSRTSWDWDWSTNCE